MIVVLATHGAADGPDDLRVDPDCRRRRGPGNARVPLPVSA